MELTKEILKEINGLAESDYYGFVRSSDRVYAAALARCLEEKTRSRLTEGTPLESYLEKRQELAQQRAAKSFSRVNRPIREVLADFSNPRSGKRMDARKELQERFVAQSFKDQIAIVKTMLHAGTMTDTAWVTKTMTGGFKSLLSTKKGQSVEIMELLYRRCDEYCRCPAIADYIVAQLPMEIVNKRQEELERVVGYRKLALRLAKESPEYVIDPSKLTLFQYLDAQAKSGRGARQYPVWENFCDWLQSLDPYMVVWEDKTRLSSEDGVISVGLSLADIREVRWLVKSCGRLGLADVVSALYRLDKKVQSRLQEFASREHANHALPYDRLKADSRFKKCLIQLAKDEIDKMAHKNDLR